MSDEATLCILAGGEARRMGRAKAELVVGGKPILVRLLDQIAWRGPTMLVTAPGREHPPARLRFDREVVDPVAGQGPLRGLLTALENLNTPVAVVLSVDMPMVGRQQVDFLIDTIRTDPARLGVMLRGGRIEPFPSIYRVGAIEAVRRHMQTERRSLLSLAEEPGLAVIDAPLGWDPLIWINLNAPADLDRLPST